MTHYHATIDGQIPFTPEEEAEWAERFAPQQPTPADFESALTKHLDVTAQQRRYDNRISCMARTGFPGPFQAEAIAFSSWADGCNLLAYQLLNEVQAGTRLLPATTKALIDALPPMVWPE